MSTVAVKTNWELVVLGTRQFIMFLEYKVQKGNNALSLIIPAWSV